MNLCKFRIGDRVVLSEHLIKDGISPPCEVIQIHQGSIHTEYQYRVKFTDESVMWVYESYIEIDIDYYRTEKLNELLDYGI